MSQPDVPIALQGRSMMAPVARADEGHIALNVTILAGCLAVLALSFILTPGEDGLTVLGHPWPFACRLYETLGIRCSLCGMSRSFCSLAHGDIASAVQFHRLGPAIFALFCLEVPYRLYQLAAGPGRANRKIRRLHAGLVLAACAALCVNWLSYLGGLFL